MRVNRRAYLAAAAGVGSMIAGCSGGNGSDPQATSTPGGGTKVTSSGDQGKAEVTVITDDSDPEWREFYTRAANDFTQETGIPVTVEFTGLGAGLAERLTTLIQSGNPPSMFSSYGTQEGGALYLQDLLEPLDDVQADLEESLGAVPESWKFAPGGTNYAALHHVVTFMNWWRTDMYDIPSNYDDFLTQAAEVDSQETRAALVAANERGLSTEQLVCLAGANGAEVATMSESSSEFRMPATKDAWVETMEFMGELHQYSDSNTNIGYGEAAGQFGNGGAGWVMYAGSRAGMVAAQSNPELAADMSPSRFIASDGPGSYGVVPMAGGWYVLSSDLIGEDAVANTKEFINYLLGDRERYLERSLKDPLQALPCYTDFRKSDMYTQAEPFQQNESFARWLEMLEQDLIPDSDIDAAGLPAPFWGPMISTWAWSRMVNDHIIGGKDASQAFDDHLGPLEETYNEIEQKIYG